MKVVRPKASYDNPLSDVMDQQITLWLRGAQGGDKVAFARLFDSYIHRLQRYLRRELSSVDRAQGFEDDLASQCMTSVWYSLDKGVFSRVANREELWYAMMRVAKSHALDRRKYHRRKKRLSRLLDLCNLATLFKQKNNLNSDAVEFDFLERWEFFLKTITNPERELVNAKLDGINVRVLADRTDSVPRAIQRKLKNILRKWELFVATQECF